MENLQTGGFIQGILQQSAIQNHELNTIRTLKDGRVFAYAKAGATALAAGKVNQAPVFSSNANNEALSSTQSAAIGATEVVVTFGGAVTADFYKDGYFYINDATGESYAYRVKGHAAGTADVTLYLKDPIRVALVASTSEWSCVQNRQDALIIGSIPTITGPVAGIAPIAVTAAYYFWNQVKGVCTCLVSGTWVVGDPLYPLGVAGALGPMANTGIMVPIATALAVNADTEYGLCALHVPGY